MGTRGNFTKMVQGDPKTLKQTTESIFILLKTILGTNGDKWGLKETFGD